ncbi:MAG TPA: glycosyltransferase [Anaerolineales bacterium]|nr:glycosyltransferase [Anaerolineales bacterium]
MLLPPHSPTIPAEQLTQAAEHMPSPQRTLFRVRLLNLLRRLGRRDPEYRQQLAYQRWLAQQPPPPANTLPPSVRFSILLPVYQPPLAVLQATLQSVLAQTYPHWQLCVVDDASPNPQISAYLRQFAAQHPRVSLRVRSSNGHITASSADALALANGEFVLLLDHDDLLAPHALHSLAQAIAEHPTADYLYTDEDKLTLAGERFAPFFKPDWSPDLLMAQNYLTHLSCIRRELLHTVGGFRAGFDGSQDYDLLLRVTEQARHIVHVPHILYHWRISTASTALAPTAKFYAYQSAMGALQSALERRGQAAHIEMFTRHAGHYLLRRVPAHPHARLGWVTSGTPNPHLLSLAQPSGGNWLSGAELSSADSLAHCDYLVFCHPHLTHFTPDWLEQLLAYAQLPHVGMAGGVVEARNGRILHAGWEQRTGQWQVVGAGEKRAVPGVNGRLLITRNVPAVSAMLAVLSVQKLCAVGGWHTDLPITSAAEIELGTRLQSAGWHNVIVSHARGMMT